MNNVILLRYKLASAQRSDPPRWGDYPEKMELNYIASLRRFAYNWKIFFSTF